MAPPHTSAGALSRTLPRMDRTARGVRWEKHCKTSAAADEQLQHIPHHLRQVAVGTQKQMVQITQYKR